jgi:hypothetical protein
MLFEVFFPVLFLDILFHLIFLFNLIFILLIVYSLCFTFLLIFFQFHPSLFYFIFVKSQNYYLKLGRSLNCIPWAVN